jgi:hypothetical protein
MEGYLQEMSALSSCGDCRRASSITPRGNLRFSRGLSSFPETVTPRIAGTFCRMRWFVRYARGEARLCRRPDPILLER